MAEPHPAQQVRQIGAHPRIVSKAAAPGLIVTTMKIAARIKRVATDCETGGGRLETIPFQIPLKKLPPS